MSRSRLALLLRGLVLAAAVSIVPAARAIASSTQVAIFEDDGHLAYDPVGTIKRLRLLGVEQLRVPVRWVTVAPSPSSRRRPPGFNASDPAAYPSANWAQFDNIVKD